MSTEQLRAAVQSAGTHETAATAAVCFVASEHAMAEHNPVALIFAGLHATIMRDVIGLDPVLVGAVVAATDQRPGSITLAITDLQQADPDGLPGALAREVALAAYDAADQVARWREDVDQLDDLDRLDGDGAA